ncbi:hypothetical protein Q4F19_18120 [Sphingomonas sp. BIUV-7]|uniref:Uncharacterized protein n=1 Tax=Sphingomonas natans TaxID=3063330 RepID=A0ABT8YEV4_9SPHN|nr:hypothetical protein [Sphingomonas sp. BIUV-7]MDO6416308.1 hypothetical protein [Sphingomonas sp. BIUV-7]
MIPDPKNHVPSEPTSDEQNKDALEKVQEEAAEERKEGGYQ